MNRWLPIILGITVFVFLCVGCTVGMDESQTTTREHTTEQMDIMENGKITQESDYESMNETYSKNRNTEENKEDVSEQVDEILSRMTIEEKVAQLFIVVPEAITNVRCVTVASDVTKQAINEFPVGGFVYMGDNLRSTQQVWEMLSNVQRYSRERLGIPAFLCVDEEGGSVEKIAGSGKFDIPSIESMSKLGSANDIDKVKQTGDFMGEYLHELGFNIDFAPVADVLTNMENKVVADRSFGSNPDTVAQMAGLIREGLNQHGVLATYKHFPGHGSTASDSHKGYAYSESNLEELQKSDLIPFQKGIEEGVSLIMVGHISFPAITGDNTPASLSPRIVQDILREQMGYDGVVITDAMNMGAITNNYSSSDAAMNAFVAGCDIILMPKDFSQAYEGMLQAVSEGVISERRIDESVRRILKVKLKLEDN